MSEKGERKMKDIQCHFCNGCNLQQRPMNEACVNKVVDAYKKEGIDLEKKGKILFFFAFNSRSVRYPDELGALISKGFPENENFNRDYADEVNLFIKKGRGQRH